jgi:hypothetical protein
LGFGSSAACTVHLIVNTICSEKHFDFYTAILLDPSSLNFTIDV